MKLLYILLAIPLIAYSQTATENYIKTTTYRKNFQGEYTNFTQGLNHSHLFVNTQGGASGTIALNNNILTVSFSGSLSATSNALKTQVKGPLATPALPDMELGPIMTSPASTSVPTGFFAKIKDNYLTFYSPYYIKSINTVLSAPIASGTLSYSVNTGNIYTCLSGTGGGGGGSGTISINNGTVTFSASGGWSDVCNVKTGQVVYLNTVSLPNTELGVVKIMDGTDSAYRAKIENNWFVIYSPTPIPAPPATVLFNVSTNITLGIDGYVDNIAYYDGLGREKQTIQARQGSLGQDIITPVVYNDLAMKVKEYLPYEDNIQSTPISSLNYRDNNNLITSLEQFYQTTNPDDFGEAQPNPYSEKVYDKWSEGKVLESAAPGSPWKVNTTSNTDRTIKFEYRFNNLEDKVKRYSVNYINNIATLQPNGVYPPNALFKNIVKNENWSPTQSYQFDNTTIEFKDIEEKIILKRSYNFGRWHDTYYVYDVFGNLSFVLPPIVNTYPNSQLIWPTYSYSGEDDFSFYPVNHNSTYNEVYFSFDEAGGFYFYLYDYDGPGKPLKTGLIKDLNLSMYPDVVLGPINIMTNTDGIYSDQHYQLVLHDGDLYIEGDGTIAYGVEAEIGYSFGNYQGDLGISITSDDLDKYAYQYRYDRRHRVVEKKMPGKAWEYIVYDNLDRPVLTQNALLRGQTTDGSPQTQNKWQFVKYDAFNRKIYSGIWTNPNVTQSRVAIQSSFDLQTIYNESRQSAGIAFPESNLFYSNNCLPNTNIELHSIQYYDTYTDLDNLGMEPSFGISPTTNTQSLETVKKVRILDDIKWITTVTYYDKKAKPIYIAVKNNLFEVVDKTKIKYDFIGNIIEKEETHSKTGYAQIKVNNKYSYDNSNKLVTHKQAINTSPEQLICKNYYDVRGNLIKKLVGNSETNPLQQIDYSYNSRGWLKSINNPDRMGNDIFVFKLSHEHFEQTPTGYFNGNISGSSWRTDNVDSKMKFYRYSYDNLGRFRNSQYGENFSVGTNYKYNEVVSGYDRNGNILNSYRYSPDLVNPLASALTDNLQYTYSGNKLIAVKDHMGNSANGIRGFYDQNTIGNDYQYDPDGNLISDKNKKITNIIYNELNLPKTVTFENGDKIVYTYDSEGNKLIKQTLPMGNPGAAIQYSGNFVYEKLLNSSPNLQFFAHPEGYVAVNSGVFSYIFQFKDHLGNIRVSYTDANNDGIIKSASTEVYYDGFESASGWNSTGSIYGGQVTAYDTTRKHSGKYSAKISKPTPGEIYVHSDTWIPVNHSQPTEYILSGWIYSTGPVAELWLHARRQNEPGYPIYAYNVSSYTTGAWTYLEKRITVPADAIEINVRLDNNGGGDVWYDDINVRTVNTNAVVEIIEDNSYYPFGLKHEDNSPVILYNGNALAQNYKFGGKELDKSFNLNTYDFGARNYDPVLGRWNSIDPLGDKREWLTPYNYVQNNPLARVDQNGRLDDWYLNDTTGELEWFNGNASRNGYTYLGEDLTFHFSSFIDRARWYSDAHRPRSPFDPSGEKLYSRIKLDFEQDAKGNLIGLKNITESTQIMTNEGGFTGVLYERYNFFNGSRAKYILDAGTSKKQWLSYYYERHAKVPFLEAIGLLLQGGNVVNVAQSLQLTGQGNKIKYTSKTDIFPSASLHINDTEVMRYMQPSYQNTHGIFMAPPAFYTRSGLYNFGK